MNVVGKQVINSFKNEYRFLSNFAFALVEFDGCLYPTVEHAYQAAKTENMEDRRVMCGLHTPGDAKRFGKFLKIRDDWESVKLGIMEELVRCKFFNDSRLAQMLLLTGDAELIEGNYWGDVFWGVCRGRGNNHLGRILMKVRKELRGKNYETKSKSILNQTPSKHFFFWRP